MKSTQLVHVADTELATASDGLLSWLEHSLPVHFTDGPTCPESAVGQFNSFSSVAAALVRPAGLAKLVLPDPTRTLLKQTPAQSQIRFADDPLVPWPFRGRSVEARIRIDGAAQAGLHSPWATVLAFTGDGLPVWTVDERDHARTYRTSLCLPYAPKGVDVGIAAAAEQFIQTLPLIHFLRALTEQQRLVEPPLRAAYIIDDPNLHWPRYGFADFRAIAASARRDGYHVAFATIPLDAWWVHPGAASIFRSHSEGLSLLVHGNNHARHELAQDCSPEDCDGLLIQAGQRIRQLELKSGLQVCRVMVPPHGACSSRMLGRLPRHGFESACISAGSLRAHNAGEAWTTSLGLGPSETVEGCPVLPRWAFSGTTDIALLTAAYLGQPLVLRGHHQDLKDGIDIFRDFARKINTLGQVCWGSLSTLSRLNYRHRVEGRSMQIQPLGIRIEVSVPDGIDELRIDPGGFEWQAAEPGGPSGEMVGKQWIVPLNGRRRFSFVRATGALAPNRHARPNATSAKLMLRRVLTEVRDRLRVT